MNMKMNRMRKSLNVELWLLMLPAMLAVASFVAESRAQSIPKPQLTITTVRREPMVVAGNPNINSKLTVAWSVSAPPEVQISNFHLGGRKESAGGSSLLRFCNGTSDPTNCNFSPGARQGEFLVQEPINTPVTFNIELRANYTLNPPLTLPVPDVQRSGTFPDAGVAAANGAIDPPNPKATLTKVAPTPINGYSSGTAPISLDVTVAIKPESVSSGCGGGAFGGSTSSCTSPGFDLKSGKLELAVTFTNGATVSAVPKSITSAGKVTISVPRPQPGASAGSFNVRLTGITAQLNLGDGGFSVVATKTVTL